jgi:hypothetical protein
MKAIEVGAKLMMIQHKIKSSGGKDDGNFFG